jgi:hypothetical protein
MLMQSGEKTAFERFLDVFAKRYQEDLKYVGLVSVKEMVLLFCQFKGSGKTPEQWIEEQELS